MFSYVNHYYPKLTLNNIPFILNQQEILLYENQTRQVLLDHVQAFSEQAMNETRRCNVQFLPLEKNCIGTLHIAAVVEIKKLLIDIDLELLTSYRLACGNGMRFLTEISTVAPTIPLV